MNQSNVSHLSRDVRFAAPSTTSPVLNSAGIVSRQHTPRSSSAHDNASAQQRNKFVAKGHDAQLQEAQYDKIVTVLTAMSGAVFTGTITKRDKYTVTLRHADGDAAGQEEIFYKHALEGIRITRPAFLSSN